jgi:EcoEI R protein C-terminal
MTFATIQFRHTAVSLVRYAMHQENELVPYPERVAANFKAWVAQQQAAGKGFSSSLKFALYFADSCLLFWEVFSFLGRG